MTGKQFAFVCGHTRVQITIFRTRTHTHSHSVSTDKTNDDNCESNEMSTWRGKTRKNQKENAEKTNQNEAKNKNNGIESSSQKIKTIFVRHTHTHMLLRGRKECVGQAARKKFKLAKTGYGNGPKTNQFENPILKLEPTPSTIEKLLSCRWLCTERIVEK